MDSACSTFRLFCSKWDVSSSHCFTIKICLYTCIILPEVMLFCPSFFIGTSWFEFTDIWTDRTKAKISWRKQSCSHSMQMVTFQNVWTSQCLKHPASSSIQHLSYVSVLQVISGELLMLILSALKQNTHNSLMVNFKNKLQLF